MQLLKGAYSVNRFPVGMVRYLPLARPRNIEFNQNVPKMFHEISWSHVLYRYVPCINRKSQPLSPERYYNIRRRLEDASRKALPFRTPFNTLRNIPEYSWNHAQTIPCRLEGAWRTPSFPPHRSTYSRCRAICPYCFRLMYFEILRTEKKRPQP